MTNLSMSINTLLKSKKWSKLMRKVYSHQYLIFIRKKIDISGIFLGHYSGADVRSNQPNRVNKTTWSHLDAGHIDGSDDLHLTPKKTFAHRVESFIPENDVDEIPPQPKAQPPPLPDNEANEPEIPNATNEHDPLEAEAEEEYHSAPSDSEVEGEPDSSDDEFQPDPSTQEFRTWLGGCKGLHEV
ncbi:hypothetical protein LguiA_018740 [Lonicera macranthoides]